MNLMTVNCDDEIDKTIRFFEEKKILNGSLRF